MNNSNKDIKPQDETKVKHLGKFVVKTSRKGQCYFVLKAKNGKTLVQSEMYETKASCLKGIESVRKNVPDAEVVDD